MPDIVIFRSHINKSVANITDHNEQTTGFFIYKIADNTTEVLYQDRHTIGNRFTIPLEPAVALQTLTIENKRGILTICELKLVESGKYFQ